MAPFIGPGRAEVLRKLRLPFGGRLYLPMTLGQHEPAAVIARERDGRYRVRLLVVDRTRVAAAEQEERSRSGTWVPEMTWRGLVPGEPIAEASSARGLAAALERLEWRW
jgi:hypothetical protein